MKIDCNANLGPFALRNLRADGADALVARMGRYGIAQSWVGTLEPLLHQDPAPANDALFAALEPYRDRLLPLPTLNPACCGWERELDRSLARGARMVRIFPSYQGFALDDAVCVRLAAAAARAGALLVICLYVLDERSHPAACSVPPLDLKPLPELLELAPGVRVLLQNARSEELVGLQETFNTYGDLWAEISHVEKAGVLDLLAETVGVLSLTWGTYTPVFYAQAAALKLLECDLSPEQIAAIGAENACRIMAEH